MAQDTKQLNQWGTPITAFSDPSQLILAVKDMVTGVSGPIALNLLLSGVQQNVIARLLPNSAGEWNVPAGASYLANQSVHYTDPSFTNSGVYLAPTAIAAGIAPPAAPWVLLSLDGKDGKSSIVTITATHPNIPAVGSSATYSADSNAGLTQGQYVTFGTGVLTVASLSGTTGISLTNVDAVANTPVAVGAKLVPAGKPGAKGNDGTNGISAIATASPFPQPAVNANVTVTVNSSAGFVDKQPLFHTLGGFYSVAGTPPSATTVVLKNLGYAGNIAAAGNVAAGTLVPSGLKGLDGSGSSGGGASGLQYKYQGTTGTAGAGEIRGDLAAGGAIAINPTDDQQNVQSTLLAKIKVGATIRIQIDAANWAQFEVTGSYASGSVTVGAAMVEGAISSGATVFLSILSDAAIGGALSAGEISGSVASTTATLSELTTASGGWPPYQYSWYKSTSSNFAPTGNLVSGASSASLTDTGLANGTAYYYRRVVTDALGNKANTTQVSVFVGSVSSPPTIASFSPDFGATGDSVVIAGTNFSGTTAVTFNGVNATSFTVNSSTQITAIVPSGSTGLISVANAAGTASSTTKFYKGIFASDFNSLTPTDKFGHTVNVVGATLNTTNFDTSPASLDFSAGQANFTIAPGEFLTGDFEIRAWIRLTAATGSGMEVFCIRQNANQEVGTFDILLEIDQSNLSVRFRITNNSGAPVINCDFNSSANAIALNTAYQLVAKVEGTTASVLLNGTQISTASLVGNRAQTLTTAMFGALYVGGSSDRFFTGQIDSVRVLK